MHNKFKIGIAAEYSFDTGHETVILIVQDCAQNLWPTKPP